MEVLVYCLTNKRKGRGILWLTVACKATLCCKLLISTFLRRSCWGCSCKMLSFIWGQLNLTLNWNDVLLRFEGNLNFFMTSFMNVTITWYSELVIKLRIPTDLLEQLFKYFFVKIKVLLKAQTKIWKYPIYNELTREQNNSIAFLKTAKKAQNFPSSKIFQHFWRSCSVKVKVSRKKNNLQSENFSSLNKNFPF